MFRKILLLSSFVCNGFFASAQTTATDFNVNDCAGNPRHLFSELDAGKVIVMSMVHPCGSCISPTLSAKSVVGSFAASNPGKVVFYLTDDVGNTNCTTLSAWAGGIGLGGEILISSASVSQLHYGGAAMPKIVVLAGKDHKVYFKQDNSLNTANLTAAINQAIAASSGMGDQSAVNMQLSLHPNPAAGKINLTYFLTTTTEVSMDVYSMNGARVKSISATTMPAGQQATSLDVEDLAEGLYFLNFTAGESVQAMRFLVKRGGI